MTELLIVSKPRGRIFKWIGGGVYKQYPSLTRTINWAQTNLTGASYGTVDFKGGDSHDRYRCQQFITSNYTIHRVKVVLHVSKVGNPMDTVYVHVWGDTGSNMPNPNNVIGTIGSFTGTQVGTSETQITIQGSLPTPLQANTKYWIVVERPIYDVAYYYRLYLSSTDYNTSLYSAYRSGASWTQQTNDYKMRIFSFGQNTFNFDFIYDGAVEKRLNVTATTSNTTINNYVLNGQTYTTITQGTSIPQADNYTLTVNFTENTAASDGYISLDIQRWLYCASTTCTIDDLNVAEAYLQEILFHSSGGVLRIDGDPSAYLVGQANEKITFTDAVIPFRKLEWVSGGGEVTILGIE